MSLLDKIIEENHKVEPVTPAPAPVPESAPLPAPTNTQLDKLELDYTKFASLYNKNFLETYKVQ